VELQNVASNEVHQHWNFVLGNASQEKKRKKEEEDFDRLLNNPVFFKRVSQMFGLQRAEKVEPKQEQEQQQQELQQQEEQDTEEQLTLSQEIEQEEEEIEKRTERVEHLRDVKYHRDKIRLTNSYALFETNPEFKKYIIQ